MEILAHRGYWNAKLTQNSLKSFSEALRKGYGFESDLRDYMGNLVISHDIANSNAPNCEDVFAMLNKYGDKHCFAINIKADGLDNLLLEKLSKYKINNYFTFDMSIPQMLEYRSKGITYFTRQSEYEPKPALYKDAAGVWLDSFEDDSWITQNLIIEHQEKEKMLCIVSPELHKRERLSFWKRLGAFAIDFSKIKLCTDFPDEAKIFFRL